MSYVVPSVQILQQLTQSGGVDASTPDLNACIVGPLYNVVRANVTSASDYAKSLVAENFIFQTSGNSEGNTKYKFTLPSRVLGQVLDSSSLVFVVKNAYVKVNDFTADMLAATLETNSGDAENTSVLAATSIEYAFNTNAPDGQLSIKAGDRIKYTVKVGTVDTPRVTSVRSVDVGTSKVTLANGVGTVDNTNDAVVVEVYRLVPIVELRPSSAQLNITDANTSYEIAIAESVSGFPLATTPAYHVIDLVASLNVGYRALRTDKSQTVLTVTSTNRESVLGVASKDNPLSLAASAALSNTLTSVKVLSIASDTETGYETALDILTGDRTVYALVPLTHSSSIISMFKAHALQMSVPVEAGWRTALVNTKIPDNRYWAGTATTNGSCYVKQTRTGSSPSYVYRTFIIDPDVDFLASGVVATDIVEIPTFTLGNGDALPTNTTASNFIGTWEVSAIIDSNTVEVVPSGTYTYAVTASSQSNGQFIPYKGYRAMTKDEQAAYVASVSAQSKASRVWNIGPDSVTINIEGVDVPNLPGYYLAAAHAGMVAGFPVQQGFTNIGVAGISDLQHSNNYFNKDQLNVMAEAGTCLYVQAVQGGIPYCRHAVTTDMSVLEYREQLKVKNWDFLSYFYYDKLKSFIGSWNITTDTLQIIRTTIIAASELLKSQVLPRIGAPLLGYQILTLEQNKVNKDRISVKLRLEIVSPANYIDVILEI